MLARVIAEVFRAERARVLATVIRVCHGDFEAAEEAVQEAFEAALARWPVEGTPDEPRGWLIAVARNKVIDSIRRRVKLRELVAEQAVDELADAPALAVADDRLRLMFTCCHPALAVDAQIALTLRTLAGLTTVEIARAFLTTPEAIAQRLVRAKHKIRGARIPYEVPDPAELPERLGAVMAVLYLVFNEGYAATAGDAWIRRDLCREAIRLARILVALTDAAEPRGLLALMLLHDSRRDTRIDREGEIVLLEDQDRTRWDRGAIDEALVLVPQALRAPGPYGIQASIAALHAQAPRAEATDWLQIVALFDELYRRHPTPIVALNRGAAIAMAQGPAAGLAVIEPLRDELADYHLFHAARGDLLRRLGRRSDSVDAYQSALACCTLEPERRFLARRLMTLGWAVPRVV
jgi:RNA polymerase sigma-70 factor, ECF subfamily